MHAAMRGPAPALGRCCSLRATLLLEKRRGESEHREAMMTDTRPCIDCVCVRAGRTSAVRRRKHNATLCLRFRNGF